MKQHDEIERVYDAMANRSESSDWMGDNFKAGMYVGKLTALGSSGTPLNALKVFWRRRTRSGNISSTTAAGKSYCLDKSGSGRPSVSPKFLENHKREPSSFLFRLSKR